MRIINRQNVAWPGQVAGQIARVTIALAVSVLVVACGAGESGSGANSNGNGALNQPDSGATGGSGEAGQDTSGDTGGPDNNNDADGGAEPGAGGSQGPGDAGGSDGSEDAGGSEDSEVGDDSPGDPGGDATGSGGDGSDDTETSDPQPTTALDAGRLLHQGAFGPTSQALQTVAANGTAAWVVSQFEEPVSRYSYTLPANAFRADVHAYNNTNGFCNQFPEGSDDSKYCWRDWMSAEPVEREFFQQAVMGSDQLRQRVAFALSQIFVTSGNALDSSYGFAHYHQMLRDNAFGNFRDLLEQVTLSPFMGKYLDMVDNAGEDPNENYAREMLQLFSLGTCLLNPDGTRQSGKCVATYDNEIVRNYAYALSGWTYPVGGVNPWCDECDDWVNPEFMRGSMVADAGQHDNEARQLLSGVVVPAGRTPEQALQLVLDSIMAHQNLAPFIGRQMIQHLVTSNPSAAYVGRVAAAFTSGSLATAGGNIGSGVRGDMRALLAAVLLDDEARDPAMAQDVNFGRLREPAQYIAGAIRALDGATDGEVLTGWGAWGTRMGQHVFHAPSVFNFYPPNFPLNGTNLQAPQFGINNTNTVLARINFANALIYYWYNEGQGVAPDQSIPGAIGTQVDYARFEDLIDGTDTGAGQTAAALNALLADNRLSQTEIDAVVQAMQVWTAQHQWLQNQGSSWQREQVKTAVFLILSSPHYQVQR